MSDMDEWDPAFCRKCGWLDCECAHMCPTCGLLMIMPDEFDPGADDYADTPGGHADRHTLVIEAAERCVEATP